jgi:hypothetical protein
MFSLAKRATYIRTAPPLPNTHTPSSKLASYYAGATCAYGTVPITRWLVVSQPSFLVVTIQLLASQHHYCLVGCNRLAIPY